jgi:signal transduction histidine kinase
MRQTAALFLALAFLLGCARQENSFSSATNANRAAYLFKMADSAEISLQDRSLYLDSLLTSTWLMDQDSLYLSAVLAKTNLHYDQSNQDSIHHYNALLLKEARSRQSPYFLGKVYFHLAYEASVAKDFKGAFYYHNLAKTQHEEIGDYAGMGRRLLSMAIIQKNNSDYFGAKETLVEAIALLEKIDEKRFLASCYNELATNHMKLSNYSDAILFYQKAIEVSNRERDKLSYRNNLALVYEETRDEKQAADLYNQVLKSDELDLQSRTYGRVLHNATMLQYRRGEKFDFASFEEALAIRKKRKDYRGQISSYLDLSEYYFDGQRKKSSSYIDSALQLARQINMPEAELEALKKLFQLEPDQVNYRDRYIFLSDSLTAQELEVKTQFAKMKYDNEQNKSRLNVLKAASLEQDVQLANQQNKVTLFFSLCVLLIVLGTSMAYILTQRHRKKTLEEIFKTEKRISQDLHDGLANEIFGVMARVQSSASDDAFLLPALEKIYETTRKVSHENSSIQYGAAFPEEVLRLVQSYQDEKSSILVSGLREVRWEHLNETKSVIVHRLLRELLVNMKKHASATVASIQFDADAHLLYINYSDNGVGLSGEHKSGKGLQHIEERLATSGGRLLYPEQKEKGLKLKIEMPFHK